MFSSKVQKQLKTPTQPQIHIKEITLPGICWQHEVLLPCALVWTMVLGYQLVIQTVSSIGDQETIGTAPSMILGQTDPVHSDLRWLL